MAACMPADVPMWLVQHVMSKGRCIARTGSSWKAVTLLTQSAFCRRISHMFLSFSTAKTMAPESRRYSVSCPVPACH